MKRVSKVLIIISLIFTIIGSTFAYLTWQATTSERTEVTFTVTSDFSCAADGGGDITSSDVTLFPCECTNSTYAIKREIKVTPTINTPIPVYMDLWLDINELGTGLSNSDNFRYALTTNSDSCANPISSGTFKNLSAGDKVTLLNKMSYSETITDTYYLWIWLDKEETSSDTMNQVVSLSLNGNCTDQIDISPDVPDGLIPITIANNGTVTTISKTDDNWYNYNQKKWANAILVTESSRSTYQNSTGITIPENNILAYYVWIPRYKYKIWTTGTSATGQEQEIDILFETKDTTKSRGTQVGEYITHPAFTFGDEELAGIWIGKFETSADTSSTCYTCSGYSDCVTKCNNANQEPRIKPNVKPLTFQNISTQFQISLKFAGGTLSNGTTAFVGSETYGLSNEVNSHMAKNDEWGAVAYLSHSRYGINDEVRINNYGTYTNNEYIPLGTGCGASIANANSSSTCDIAYGSGVTSYPQSTTGNITGVFDMSGGANEYVMGNYSDFIGYSGFSALPESKYYDKYTTTSGLTACNGGYCYGHGLSEVNNWYEETAAFVWSEFSWLERGGSYRNRPSTGAFHFYCYDGITESDYSFRSILVFE